MNYSLYSDNVLLPTRLSSLIFFESPIGACYGFVFSTLVVSSPLSFDKDTFPLFLMTKKKPPST